MENFEVIIIGGSYAGLSAAMSLGRALRKVLIIDSGQPCNRQTPHSHNFLTQDGNTPREIAAQARAQVALYTTIRFYEGLAIEGKPTATGFQIATQSGDVFNCSKLVFATGVKDIMPQIQGFSDCWGISVIHCPYCHGYEVRNEKTGILLNGDMAFEFSKLISNWTMDLTLFTNGKSTLNDDQLAKLQLRNIQVIEDEINSFEHIKGKLSNIVFKNGSKIPLKALYHKPAFEQHCPIAAQLGCELNEQGYIKVDAFQKTTVHGIYACGDNTTPMRSVSAAVAAGTLVGAVLNKEIIDELF